MSEWDAEEDDARSATSPPPLVVPKKTVRNKWVGEDEEGDGPVSHWEQSSEEEENLLPSATAAPPKKKGTLKAKLAEKEAAKAAQAAAAEEDSEFDEDVVLDPREKALLDKERELKADLDNAAALFGAAALGGTSSSELDSLLSVNLRTKDDFQSFSQKIIEYIIKRHQRHPLYASFIESHVRELALPLKDVEVRKVASGLITLASEKQKEQRDKASGKKKPKAAAKPALGAAKVASKLDTSVYDEALDDFDSVDFM